MILKKLTPFLVTGIIAITMFRLGQGCNKSNVTLTNVDTFYVDRQITKRDTVNIYKPYRVMVYDTVETVRVDTIRVPVDFGYVGVVGENAVTLDNDGLTLTSFDLRRGRFTQQTFMIPERKWGFGIYSSTTVSSVYNRIAIEMDIRYQRVTLSPLVGVETALDDALRLVYGARIRYKLF